MIDPVYFFGFFIAMCGGVQYMAQNRSYLGVNLSKKFRYTLLIFSRSETKTSIFAVLSQLYLYVMLVLFAAFKVLPTEIIDTITSDSNAFMTWICLFHFAILFPIGMIESSICEWRYSKLK